ncbi:MAG: LuxR C-terminal-related transcriptional regulator [Vicinamibacteria bacterium]|jgi:DNA-binding CsgD family transcriptional regulator
MPEALAAAEISPDRVAGSAKALLVVDDDCVCVEASLGACRMLGVGRAEIVGRPLELMLEPESRARFGHVWLAFRGDGGHAEPFALEAPATVVEVAATVTAHVLPSRHLITLDPVSGAEHDSASRAPRFPALAEAPVPREPTAREREVLQLLAEGRTDGQIADLLELSPATVQTHVRNAKAKLGARTRAQAVALALQRGLIGAL